MRHGETEWNKLQKFQGCRDIELSEEGVIQAKKLEERFMDLDYVIYSSPLKRAYKTAKIISDKQGIEPLVLEEMKEINFGQWEGLTFGEIKNNYSEEFKLWWNDKIEAPICGGDLSIKNASLRAKDGIQKSVINNKGQKIIVVSHGGIIKAGMIGIFGWDMTMYHKMILGNTSVTKIDFDSNLHPKLVYFNDTSHLGKDYKISSFV